MTFSDESTLGIFGRKVLCKIYGHLRVGNDDNCRRWNDDFYEIYGDIYILQRIRRQRLCWPSKVLWMDREILALKVFDVTPAGGSRG